MPVKEGEAGAGALIEVLWVAAFAFGERGVDEDFGKRMPFVRVWPGRLSGRHGRAK